MSDKIVDGTVKFDLEEARSFIALLVRLYLKDVSRIGRDYNHIYSELYVVNLLGIITDDEFDNYKFAIEDVMRIESSV